MQLYQRVKFIAEKLSGSQANLARHLNVHERTFQNYLNEKREDNLWPLLGPIWRLYPQVRREWLWWGEGEAFEEQPAGHAVPSGTGGSRDRDHPGGAEKTGKRRLPDTGAGGGGEGRKAGCLLPLSHWTEGGAGQTVPAGV